MKPMMTFERKYNKYNIQQLDPGDLDSILLFKDNLSRTKPCPFLNKIQKKNRQHTNRLVATTSRE